MTNNKNLQTALNLQRMGRLDEAEKVYRKIIEDEPENHDALQLQGLVLSAKGQNKAAVIHIEKAISQRPEIAAFHHNLAGIYRQSGRLQDALSSFRQAIN